MKTAFHLLFPTPRYSALKKSQKVAIFCRRERILLSTLPVANKSFQIRHFRYVSWTTELWHHPGRVLRRLSFHPIPGSHAVINVTPQSRRHVTSCTVHQFPRPILIDRFTVLKVRTRLAPLHVATAYNAFLRSSL